MSYSNEDILNLLIAHGGCQRIAERTYRVFNESYQHVFTKDGMSEVEKTY